MATVHPSRLGLVPTDSSFRDEGRYNGIDRDRERDRKRDSETRDSGYHRGSRRDDSRGDRGRPNYYVERRTRRSPSPYARNRSRGDDRQLNNDRGDRMRRSSPDYSSYRKEEPQHNNSADINGDGKTAAWRNHENMHSSGGRGRPAGGDDFFASRRAERASKEVHIWPPSPKEPTRDLSETRKKRSSKRRHHDSGSDVSDDERERRRRKEKRRKERKEKEGRKERHKKKHRHDDESYDEDSEDDHRHRRRSRSYRSDDLSADELRSRSRSRSEKRREMSRHKSRHSSRADTPPRSHADEEDAEWVEKPADSFVAVAEHTGKSPHIDHTTKEEKAADESDSEEVGPQPPTIAATRGKKVDERQYGGALLRGEGSAMAAFLQDGDTQARIPRRGEIGLTPEEIATFESVGYVMSGSRHRRMNAVRMRKENQVISAEEKRGILKLQKEERERREAILRDEFKELVEDKLKGTAAAGPSRREDDY